MHYDKKYRNSYGGRRVKMRIKIVFMENINPKNNKCHFLLFCKNAHIPRAILAIKIITIKTKNTHHYKPK
jgi:hypothetical protein